MKGLGLILLGAACSSSTPANIAGDYTVALTNGSNGCDLQGWTVGQMSTGIPVTITQSDATATAIVMGGAQLALDGLLGGHTFTGSVDGDGFDLIANGSIPMTTNGCTYTANAHIDGTLTGDSIAGEVNYTLAGNGSPMCAGLSSCLSVQDYSGSRPPK